MKYPQANCCDFATATVEFPAPSLSTGNHELPVIKSSQVTGFRTCPLRAVLQVFVISLDFHIHHYFGAQYSFSSSSASNLSRSKSSFSLIWEWRRFCFISPTTSGLNR